LPVGFGVGLPAGLFSSDFGSPGVADGLGAFRFGGTDFWTLGDVPGRAPAGDCFGPGVVGVVGLPAAGVGEAPGVPEDFTIGEAPGVLPGFTTGDAPDTPDGFTPKRFGGAGFFPAGDAFSDPPGVTFAVAGFCPGPVPGFTRLGGVCFCPATALVEPVAPGDPAFWAICGFTKGVAFGRSFGTGFC
jgi:hypothetical protein